MNRVSSDLISNPQYKRQKTQSSDGRLKTGLKEIPFQILQLIFSWLDQRETAICHQVKMFHQFIDRNPKANVRPQEVVKTIASQNQIWQDRLIYFMRTNQIAEQQVFWEELNCQGLHRRVIGYLNSDTCQSGRLQLLLNKTSIQFCNSFSQNLKDRITHLSLSGKRLEDEIFRASDFAKLTHLELHAFDISEKGLGHLRYRSLQSLQQVTICSEKANIAVALRLLKGRTNLTSLNLSHCVPLKDSDLRQLNQLVNLTRLNFSWTFLTGRGFEDLKPLVNVEEVVLEHCSLLYFEGETLSSLSAFPKLRSLNLSGSPVTNKGLLAMQTVGLARLNLSGCTTFTDAGLAGIRTFVNLFDLNLSCSNVTDLGLPYLADLVNLRNLALRVTAITGIGFMALSNLICLESLDVGYCTEFGDEGLSHLRPFQNLKRLDACHTAITDQGLEQLKWLVNLRIVFLKETRVSREALCNLKKSLEKVTFPQSYG